MFEKILLPLDGSALAEQSIPHAIEFARIFGSHIYLLHVMESAANVELHKPVEPLQWQLLKTKAHLYLHKIANQIRQALELPKLEEETAAHDRVSVTIAEGKIAENIVDFCEKEGIDLLVICSHGASGLSRWKLNSVTSKVINLVYKPILLICSHQTASIKARKLLYKRILIPVDCSQRSECALNAGISFARQSQSLLILSSVVKPMEIPAVETYFRELTELGCKMLELKHKAVSSYMEELSRRIAEKNEIHILENSNVTRTLINLAEEEKADLLILCAHGFTSDSSRPFGTIARSFIENCTRPILIIQDLNQSSMRPSEAASVAEKTRSRA